MLKNVAKTTPVSLWVSPPFIFLVKLTFYKYAKIRQFFASCAAASTAAAQALPPYPAKDAAGDGEVGEGERGEGEDSGGGRSMTKPVSSTEPVGIKNNNQQMIVVTVSRGVRTRRGIEQQVREARQEGEDDGGRRSKTKPTTKEEEGGNNGRANNTQNTIRSACP